MSSAQFDLTSVWRFPVPPEAVWHELIQVEQWPAWWPYVEAVKQLEVGGPDGVGSVWSHVWRTMLPYRLRFVLRLTRIEAPLLLQADVSGDLVGRGFLHLERAGQATLLQFQWSVRACKPWMRWLSPLARPLFLWNHRGVMASGERALAVRLG